MIYGNQSSAENFISLNIPLLDDAFDPAEEEILDHSDILPHYTVGSGDDYSM